MYFLDADAILHFMYIAVHLYACAHACPRTCTRTRVPAVWSYDLQADITGYVLRFDSLVNNVMMHSGNANGTNDY